MIPLFFVPFDIEFDFSDSLKGNVLFYQESTEIKAYIKMHLKRYFQVNANISINLQKI